MSPVQVSVVIPARDAAATLGAQLEGLAAQRLDVPWEVIVVDNGSSDATVDVARGYADRLPLRVLVCDRPGPSAARNVGAAAATGSVLLFCDADDVVAPGWVEAMRTALLGAEAAGGALEMDLLNPGMPPVQRHPAGLPVAAGFLPRALTANLGVRTSVWRSLGGLAEDYGYGAEDTEFCWRLQLAGHRLVHAPAAEVHYRVRSTWAGATRKAYRHGVARARLFRDYRSAGMPQPRLLGVAYRWARLVVLAPLVPFARSVRWRWGDEAGGAWGRLVGSVRFRVRYL
jgi:glycosyltransferase involved in cell wall biosynthesis